MSDVTAWKTSQSAHRSGFANPLSAPRHPIAEIFGATPLGIFLRALSDIVSAEPR